MIIFSLNARFILRGGKVNPIGHDQADHAVDLVFPALLGWLHVAVIVHLHDHVGETEEVDGVGVYLDAI